jgi:hypothetical protein
MWLSCARPKHGSGARRRRIGGPRLPNIEQLPLLQPLNTS